MSDPERDASKTAAALARLMALEANNDAWTPEELAAIFRHQMRTPLEADLLEAGVISAQDLQRARHGVSPPISTYGELFSHAAPPVALLVTVKEFTKQSTNNAKSPLPADVASVLYFTAIAAALWRCDQRITTLSDDALRAGCAWALSMPWLDETTRAILQSAQ